MDAVGEEEEEGEALADRVGELQEVKCALALVVGEAVLHGEGLKEPPPPPPPPPPCALDCVAGKEGLLLALKDGRGVKETLCEAVELGESAGVALGVGISEAVADKEGGIGTFTRHTFREMGR